MLVQVLFTSKILMFIFVGRHTIIIKIIILHLKKHAFENTLFLNANLLEKYRDLSREFGGRFRWMCLEHTLLRISLFPQKSTLGIFKRKLRIHFFPICALKIRLKFN